MNTALSDIPLTRIDGTPATLADYDGKVILIVNVASKCGLTPQYEGLESLYRSYGDKGLVVLGFPANDFYGQEPGTEAEISEFCQTIYGVQFPMFSKIVVTGPEKHPLYAALIAAAPEARFVENSAMLEHLQKMAAAGEPGGIHWNFEKFLLNRSGTIVGRFAPDMKPEDPIIISAVEAALAA